MNEALMTAAYKAARENYKAAAITTFKTLDAQFADAGFDTVHQAAQRAIQLHIAATDLAQKIWERTLAYEKAEEILNRQFPEFPAVTRQKALSDAHTDVR